MQNMQNFGLTKCGTQIHRIRLVNNGTTADVLTYGAALQSLKVEPHKYSMVLGLADIDAYQNCSGYFGAIVGRYANRIRDGRFMINGASYQTDQNFLSRHTLHGGGLGTDKSVWTVTDLSESMVALTLNIADGHMGFPGNMTVSVTYEVLSKGEFELRISAQTDAPTLCNFAAHNYFNLSGSGTITDHSLQINAPHYLPVDAELIPTGEIRPVGNTEFDFRNGKKIGEFEYDHNFCLSPRRGGLNEICQLSDQTQMLQMKVHSSEPGLQVFSGAHLKECCKALCHENQYVNFAGVALEPQNWPDSINHKTFPSSIILPGENYSSCTRYSFLAKSHDGHFRGNSIVKGRVSI